MIRPARQDDAEAIRSCAERAYQRYVGAIGRRPAPMDAAYRTQIAQGHVRVATDAAGDLLGFVVYYPSGKDILLENIAVRPDASGRGIGRALVGDCEDAARSRGCSVRLYTNAAMTETLSLYRHLGYAETGRRTEDGFDRVYFSKRPA